MVVDSARPYRSSPLRGCAPLRPKRLHAFSVFGLAQCLCRGGRRSPQRARAGPRGGEFSGIETGFGVGDQEMLPKLGGAIRGFRGRRARNHARGNSDPFSDVGRGGRGLRLSFGRKPFDAPRVTPWIQGIVGAFSVCVGHGQAICDTSRRMNSTQAVPGLPGLPFRGTSTLLRTFPGELPAIRLAGGRGACQVARSPASLPE